MTLAQLAEEIAGCKRDIAKATGEQRFDLQVRLIELRAELARQHKLAFPKEKER